MQDVQIILSGIWVALMLTYLLGDVLRIFSGDYKKIEMEGRDFTQMQWMGIAVLMLIPIVMIILTLTLGYPLNKWLNMVAALFLFAFNLMGLPTYSSHYDRFLIIAGLVFNLLTVWYAWGF